MALEAIRFSLEHGADINEVNAAGDTVVHIAATTNFVESGTASGSLDIVRLLAERGARLDVRNKQGRTPLELVTLSREHSKEIATSRRPRPRPRSRATPRTETSGQSGDSPFTAESRRFMRPVSSPSRWVTSRGRHRHGNQRRVGS